MREHFIYRHFFARILVVKEGREPLPCWDLCGMNIPEGQLLKHQQTQRYERNMQIQWQRRDIAIASRYADAYFSLTREEDAECVEGVETFKYLGRMLDRSDDNWTEVHNNIRKAHWVWGRLGKMLWKEGAEPRVYAIFIGSRSRQYYFLGRRPGFCRRRCTGIWRGYTWDY